MGENFPEGTSASDPSSVPRSDPSEHEVRSPRQRDEEQALGDVSREDPAEETEAEEAPESQQAG